MNARWLSQELKRRMAENLRRLNEELEKRIEARTVDLQGSQERIQAENELKELNLNLENRVNDELKKRGTSSVC
ncbi:MAG: hypothetical protein R2764_24055 [Bacteroidales bacterium]